MAFNNGFPIGYQQMYPAQNNVYPTQMNVPQTQPQPSVQNSLIWIQGEAAAKSYLVAPGNTVPLWDTESQTIYLKSADASGMPSIKTLDYTIREMQSPVNHLSQEPQIDLSKYVTRDELEGILSKLQSVPKAKEEVKGNE